MRELFIYCTFFLYTVGQSQPIIEGQKFPLDLYINNNILYSYRSYKEVSVIDQYMKRTWHNADIPKFTYEAGFGCKFVFNKHLGISTGLSYSDKGFKTKRFNVTELQSTSSGNIIVSKDYQFEYTLKFLDIYLGLLTNFPVTPRTSFFIDIGFTAGIGSIYKDNLLVNGTDRYLPSEREASIGTSGTLGFVFSVTDHFRLSIHGTSRYSPVEFSENFLLYGYGGGVSVAYRIN